MANNELTVIVDEQDNVIGQKLRSEWVGDDIHRVSALWLTNSKGEILLARRSMQKASSPGKWSTAVAGTVEVGEEYLENMVKETKEEIGLSLPAEAFIPIEKQFVKQGGGNNFFVLWYTAVCDWGPEQFTLQHDEVDVVRWITKEAFQKELQESPETYATSMRTRPPMIAHS